MSFWYIPMRTAGIYLRLCTCIVAKNDFNFLFNLPLIQIADIFFSYNDDIVSMGEILFVQSENLSEQPLDSVSLDSGACLFADRNPQSRDALPVLFDNKGKVLCIKAFT